MRTITVALVAALLGAVGLVLWWPHTEREPAGELVERSSVIELEPAPAPSANPIGAATPSSLVPPPAGAEPEAIVELQAQMVEKLYAEEGAASIDYLVAHGLERSDAERIVRKASEDSVACFFEALRLEADAQSVQFDSVLNAIEATQLDTDGPELGAIVDLEAVIDQMLPCAMNVLQQAGIPFSFSQRNGL